MVPFRDKPQKSKCFQDRPFERFAGFVEEYAKLRCFFHLLLEQLAACRSKPRRQPQVQVKVKAEQRTTISHELNLNLSLNLV
jgi:hypothetical protein